MFKGLKVGCYEGNRWLWVVMGGLWVVMGGLWVGYGLVMGGLWLSYGLVMA